MIANRHRFKLIEDRRETKTMSWEQRLRGCVLCAAFLTLWVCPATAAQVRSFADSQGVIHITNERGS